MEEVLAKGPTVTTASLDRLLQPCLPVTAREAYLAEIEKWEQVLSKYQRSRKRGQSPETFHAYPSMISSQGIANLVYPMIRCEGFYCSMTLENGNRVSDLPQPACFFVSDTVNNSRSNCCLACRLERRVCRAVEDMAFKSEDEASMALHIRRIDQNILDTWKAKVETRYNTKLPMRVLDYC